MKAQWGKKATPHQAYKCVVPDDVGHSEFVAYMCVDY